MKYDCPDILKNKRILCLDIETTGLDIQVNTIIQMGVIEWNNGVEVRAYETMFGGGHSPLLLSRRLHKIADRDRLGKDSFKDRSGKIAGYVSNSIVVTHNGSRFDIPFINRVLSEANASLVNVDYYDTFVMAKKLGHKNNSLSALSKEYGLDYGDGNHTGLADARNTLELFFLFTKRSPELLK